MGDRSHYYVSVDGTDKPLAVAAPEGMGSDQGLELDSQVWVSWSEEALVLLPQE